jgi:hypothetical protein
LKVLILFEIQTQTPDSINAAGQSDSAEARLTSTGLKGLGLATFR